MVSEATLAGVAKDVPPSPEHRPRIVIAGASGLVGRTFIAAIADRWNVTTLTRRVDGTEPAGVQAVAWNPRAASEGDAASLRLVADVLDGASAVVNLAGSSIAAGRFGRRHRAAIETSRTDATHTLVEAWRLATTPPATWLQASAVGGYGERGDAVVDEATPLDEAFFLGRVGRAWERAALPVAETSRLVIVRIGVVFDRRAEAWTRLSLPIRWFVGGPLGDGRQWWPWVHGADVARAMAFLLEQKVGADGTALSGVFNVTAPEPARQVDVARAAARALGRPCWLPVPAFLLRWVLGGLADMLLLPSMRVVPTRLTKAGFTFDFATIDEAARDLVARPVRP